MNEHMQAESACPRCGYFRLKAWNELSEEERMVALRLPGSADHTPGERRPHRFCIRCWYEEKESEQRA